MQKWPAPKIPIGSLVVAMETTDPEGTYFIGTVTSYNNKQRLPYTVVWSDGLIDTYTSYEIQDLLNRYQGLTDE